MWVAFRFPAPLRNWALFVTGSYISFGPFLDYPYFLPCYSVTPTVMTQSCWASLGQPFTLSPSGLAWPLVFSLMGSCVPFVFLLGFLDPFTNSAFSWVFTNFIGLPCPNYLILILGVHGPAINPLLSLCALLWACDGSFSLFYIIYCPWVCYFSLFGLL